MVRLWKRTIAAMEKSIVFSIALSSTFRQKSMENHAKSVTPAVVHKNRPKKNVRNQLFEQNMRFYWSFWGALSCQGPPKPSEERLKSLFFLIAGASRLKTTPHGVWKGAGRPRRFPQAPSGYHFRFILESILPITRTWKNARMFKKCRKISKNSKESWLWLGRPMLHPKLKNLQKHVCEKSCFWNAIVFKIPVLAQASRHAFREIV